MEDTYYNIHFVVKHVLAERRKVKWNGYILHLNCLVKHFIEGKIEGTGRQGKRRKLILDDLKEMRNY
jgi:hypothetical protein